MGLRLGKKAGEVGKGVRERRRTCEGIVVVKGHAVVAQAGKELGLDGAVKSIVDACCSHRASRQRGLFLRFEEGRGCKRGPALDGP